MMKQENEMGKDTILIVDDENLTRRALISGIRWEELGIGSILEAYGYQYIANKVGRQETDCDAVVDYLLSKYEDAPKPKNLGLLIHDNPDLRSQLKTMQNRASELYGMSLKQYFSEL